jgi:hypothetical protein
MVRVREEVESAREEELDTIAQLSTFCPFFRAYMLVKVCSYNTYIYLPQSTDANLLSKERSGNLRKRVKLL